VFDADVVSGELTGDDEVAELRWLRRHEIGDLDLDPLNRHLLTDLGLLERRR
jgi:hypothetical protein